MKFMVFREMPNGTVFELSGLKFRKVELAQRPDKAGYYNAIQLGIKDGHALVKEDNSFRLLPKKELKRRRRKKRKKRRGQKQSNNRRNNP
jgi:transposase